MKPKRILLIRHGESEGNVNKGMYGQKPDYALLLSDKGKQQARDAGVRLRKIVGDETMRYGEDDVAAFFAGGGAHDATHGLHHVHLRVARGEEEHRIHAFG